jgi:alpha-N-arabinofuranosidase
MNKSIILLTLTIQFTLFLSPVLSQDNATIYIKPDEPQESISPLVYGQFIEFLGNCINEGIYEPGSSLSDKNGFRKDVLEKVKQLNPPLVRYPAGTYIKIFNWKDGIGPKESRPRTKNLIWGGVEDNHFGTAEFITYCREIGAEPNLVVNMSTGTAMDAASWVEYCNGTTDSYYANLRRSHGYPEPFNVKYWALGNEEAAYDDPGRLQNPEKYVEEAWQFAKLMRLQDPSIKLVLCGTDLKWNKIILDGMYQVCDYLSIHVYAGAGSNEYGDVLKRIGTFEKKLRQTDSLIATYPLKVTSWSKWYRFPPRNEPIKIAVDEWGIKMPTGTGVMGHIVQYKWEEALGVAQFLNLFHKYSGRVGLATWAQMVNILAPVLSDKEGSVAQTIFYPMKYYRENAGNKSIKFKSVSPLLENGIPVLNVSVTSANEGKNITLFAVNFHPEKALNANIVFEGTQGYKIVKCTELNAPSVNSMNTLSEKNLNVVTVRNVVQKQTKQLTLQPHSITIIQYEK